MKAHRSIARYREQLVELRDLLRSYVDGHWTEETAKWVEDIDFIVSSGRYDVLDKHARTTRGSLYGMSRISDIVFHPDYYPRVPRDPDVVAQMNERLQQLCSDLAHTCDELLEEHS